MGAFLERFKQTKGAWLLLVGLAAGLLFLFVGEGDPETTEPAEVDTTAELATTDEYVASLERRIALLLEEMDGVSGVTVLLTADCTAEMEYAQNDRYAGGVLTDREHVIVGVNGDDRPILVGRAYPRIRGAAVVCRGGSNPILQEKIVSLLCSLLDLPATDVYVSG